MTRNSNLLCVLTILGGDQRDRDRAKAQKKTADAGKGKSTLKEKEKFVTPLISY
jgi:4F5 protein related disordered region